MDGFPRTVAQAESVDERLAGRGRAVEMVLTFEVPEEDLVERMHARAQKEGRSDDTPESFRTRLRVYGEQTAPLLAFYQERGIVTSLPGTGTVEEIAERVREAVGG
jgi:adenylate kinase